MRGVFDIETWKDVVGFEDRYEVSSLGRVRSKAYFKYGRNKHGLFHYQTTPRILKPNPIKTEYDSWYEQVKLYSSRGHKILLVHRIVAEAFLPTQRPGQIEVNHKNLIRNDNRADNLEWVTPLENSAHAWNLNKRRFPTGEKHHQQKLSEVAVKEIRRRYKDGESLSSLGMSFGVSYQTVGSVVTNKTWKEVT